MKIPLKPPTLNSLFSDIKPEKLVSLMSVVRRPIGIRNEYFHWDKLMHLTPPDNLTVKEWWWAIKMARGSQYRELPLQDKYDKPFRFSVTDIMLNQLCHIDKLSGGNISSEKKILSKQKGEHYFFNSLIEEAITSSQLEGAATTREVAKDMIRQQREPINFDEKMILNNYHAMQFIQENKHQSLTPELILRLHKIITETTLENSEDVGQLRRRDDIYIYGETNQVLHAPPGYKSLKKRLKKLCDFANKQHKDIFIHPVVKAIILHFMLAYDHPFVDGNGRTARALFYWSMANQDYWLISYISISRMIKKARIQYDKAFLYTETDDNDLTYFIIHQLDVISKGINEFIDHLKQKSQQPKNIEVLLKNAPGLLNQLNERQLSLLEHALNNYNYSYTIIGHKNSHQVTYDTARTDLLKLADLGLLNKQKISKAFVFTAPKDLRQQIASHQ